jgi:hypothetical protein
MPPRAWQGLLIATLALVGCGERLVIGEIASDAAPCDRGVDAGRDGPPPCVDSCDGRVPLVCNAAGAAVRGEACALRCISGHCADCIPYTRECLDDSPRICTLDGRWDLRLACPAGQPCSRGFCGEPRVCTVDNWCWEEPLPLGGLAAAVWGVASNDVWVVHDRSLLHWDGNAWTMVRSPLTWYQPPETAVFGVRAHESADPVFWAAGPAGGLHKVMVAREQGGEWGVDRYFDVSYRSDASLELAGLWGASPSDLWLVGTVYYPPQGEGFYSHWDGVAWSGVSVTTPLAAVWGTAAYDVWAVGGYGAIVHWNGSGFAVSPSGTSSHLRDLSGTAADDVWVAGRDGVLLHWNGSAWTSVPTGTSAVLGPVWTGVRDDVWVATDDGRLLRRQGGAWTDTALGAEQIAAMWGAAPDDVWAVGGWSSTTYDGWSSPGVLRHWDGVAWSGASSRAAAGALSDIWGVALDDVWAVGANGTIIHRDASGWSAVASGTTAFLGSVRGTASDDVWALGWDSTGSGTSVILHWDGSSWSLSATSPGLEFGSLWAATRTNAWAVGADNLMLEWDGNTWTLRDDLTSAGLRALWGTGPDDVWAVGNEVLRWDGTAWSVMAGAPSGSTVWGADRDDVWVAGTGWNLNHWDGATWTPRSAGVPLDGILGLVGYAPDDVWATGYQSTCPYPNLGCTMPDDTYMLHWNGSMWSAWLQAAGPCDFACWRASRTWAPSPDDIFAVAEGGVVHWRR